MAVVRFSLMQPRPGCEQEIQQIEDELLAWFTKQKGFIMGFRIGAMSKGGEIGRITLWNAHDDADATATQDHSIALRSRLLRLSSTHQDALFEVKGTPLAAVQNVMEALKK